MHEPPVHHPESPDRAIEGSRRDRPERIAVYGTLRSDGSASGVLAALISRREDDTALPGTLYDTGYGYPAFVLAAFRSRDLRERTEHGVPAEVYRLRDPRSALPVLDEYEGRQYERRVIEIDSERSCWVYVWRGSVEGMRRLSGGWTDRPRR